MRRSHANDENVLIPTDGLIPMTIPSARLHARRRGVTPRRSSRSSGLWVAKSSFAGAP